MVNQHSYKLSWIKREKLVDLVFKNLKKSIDKADSQFEKDLKTDPTLNLFRRFAFNMSTDEIKKAEIMVSATKTLQNAIGILHQDILGSIDGFHSHGSAGGVIDISSSIPLELADNKKMLAEIKMRWNTIKASDERHTWEKIDQATRSRDTSEYTGYLIQIIPKNRDAYDRPWVPSGVSPREHVRHIDGVTAYYYMTGEERALHDLMHELPYILFDAFPEKITNPYDLDEESIRQFIDSSLIAALPDSPAKYRQSVR